MDQQQMSPEQYPRRILIAVTGLSPQILTETLYALTQVHRPAFVPTEVHLITTRQGAEHARLTLLDPHLGRFQQLCRDYSLPPIAFDAGHIHIIRDSSGQPLGDIRTPDENASAADCITSLMREITSDPDCALHVSIAGGRKTMGFYLGYALSLFGREQDRLSHVLVSEPFENNHGFYFPPREPQVLFTRDNHPISTADATVELASIPFVRLRESMAGAFDGSRTHFSDVVTATQRSLNPPRLVVHRGQCLIECGGQPIELPPIEHAFYRWLAERCMRQPAGEGYARHTDPVHQEFAAIYRQHVGEMAHDYEQLQAQLEHSQGFSKEWFEQKRSKINGRIKKALPLDHHRYLIASDGRRPVTRWGIALPPDSIHLV